MVSSRSERRQKKKKKRTARKVMLVVLILVLVVVGYGGYLAFNAYRAAYGSYNPLDRDKSKMRKEAVQIGKDPISILLMGVENYATHGKGGRTDTLIVVTLNPHTHKMTMTSIPRDSRVMIAGKGQYDKINSAYPYGDASGYGGNKAIIDTVENYLNIPIDYYAKINFKGFKEVVDELGGIDVNVPFSFWEYDESHKHKIYFHKGKQHLNGKEALAYVRMRHRDPRGDFGRNQRQRQVIRAAINKAKSANTLFKIDDITNILGKNVETNLKPSEIYGLEQAYSKVDSSKIKTYKLDVGTDATINGVYYFIPDEANVQKVSRELNSSLGLKPRNTGESGTDNSTGGTDTGTSGSNTDSQY
ncbi:LCP family protein [Scopulibacillus cellulosilyticus]|uniref:LCP family protein n=1 Tax=Scopulibacillus cellulosilyticus TaxID=2665665 RepID=A0ABW2Q0A9_9BACL